MWCLLMGGLYPPALNAQVEELLAGGQSTILDLGCGSGIWCVSRTMDVAYFILSIVTLHQDNRDGESFPPRQNHWD